MIACRDFAPQQVEAPNQWMEQITLAEQGKHESLQAAIAAANEWISKENLEVVSVETVVLPNIWERDEQGTQDVSLRLGNWPRWHQFVRVWYRT
jgi:hypothetical protein